MPRVESSVVVPVSAAMAFAVSQTTGEIRYRWDPFVAEQRFLDDAMVPGKNVRTETKSRHRLKMISPSGWNFREVDEGTEVTWRYTFTIRPKFLAPIADRIGLWFLGRDIDRRLAGYAKGCEDDVVLRAAAGLYSAPD